MSGLRSAASQGRRMRLAVSVATMAVALGVGTAAAASTITFDSLITQPSSVPPPVDLGIALDYENNDPPGEPDALYTQGFAFGGRTQGVTGSGSTKLGLGIVTDPSLCPSLGGTACADNGTQTLSFDVAASMVKTDASLFSFTSFDASQAFQDDTACPTCNDGIGLQNAILLSVIGFSGSTLVAQQTFTLAYGYQTYSLVGPGWSSLDRVVFQPLDAFGIPGIKDVTPCCTLALDNLQVQAPAAVVPEPSTMLLLGGGLALLATRRFRRERR